MESGDEDMFAISDEELSSPARTAPVNPVEEHLLQQLSDVQNRINVAVSEIAETKATTARILNALEWRAIHGEDRSSDSDGELYTVEGVPMVKKQKRRRASSRASSRASKTDKILELISQWQCVLQDKWIIVVKLFNRSCCTLLKPKYYPYVSSTRDEEIFGESAFWKLKEEHFFYSKKTNSIQPGVIVATMVLDLPKFDQEHVVECWGIISYEIDEIQFQIPLPSIQLSIVETIDSSCIQFLDENKYGAILVLKSTSTTEQIVNIQLSRDDQDGFGNKLCRFLTAKNFTKVCGNVFLMKEHGSLMYCLVEIQSIDVDEANIRIFARSVNQVNIILHILQDEFSNASIAEEIDDCIEAAMALIHELEVIRDKKSINEIQEAKVITDLLIP